MRFIGNIEKDAQIRAVASGALPSGDAVIVNSDGTVSAVEGVVGGAGSKATFESATVSHLGAVYDVGAGKVVVFYRDQGNSYYGTAAVGTISGTSISFGTPVVFFSDNSSYSQPVYDANSSKIVNYFSRDPDNYGVAIVGTVSGTSISFGTSVVYASAQVRTLGAAYATNSATSVVLYRDESAGNVIKAVAGTVSGTSISFGATESAYNASTTGDGALAFGADTSSSSRLLAVFSTSSATISQTLIASGTSVFSYGTTEVQAATSFSTSAVYDSVSNRFLVVYRDASNNGKSRVASISGTTISLGTETSFFPSGSISGLKAVVNTTSNVVTTSFYSISGNVLQFIDGTISGETITYATPYASPYSTAEATALAYDSTANKVASFFIDASNSNHGASAVYTSGSTNLTAENFVGFAAHTYADTQSALINSTCTVDRNQSGLTAGQTYYVQTDGTLGTTPGDPSVVAGTAISTTSIIVKG